MRKSTKIAMLVVAIVLLASLTVFAKGWKQDDNGWYFEDAYGMMEYLKWEKSGSNYYYLGEDGYMVTNALVTDDNGNIYWCGADGAKVINTWVQVPADEYDQDQYGVEYRWYHFGATGKADVNKSITYNGNKYYLDSEGKMLFGYHDGSTIISLESPFNASKYYCGSNEDGAMVKEQWYRIDVTDMEAYEEDTFKWVFYKKNGQKATDADESGVVWKNNRYYFEEDGKMKYSYNEVTLGAATQDAYLSDSEDGHMVKKAWVYAKPQDDTNDDDKHWYYYGATGEAVSEDIVKKINGKYYAFYLNAAKGDSTAARMLAKFVKLSGITDSVLSAHVDGNIDPTDMTRTEWVNAYNAYAGDVYYFSGDEANDGSLKKGTTVTVEMLDDTYNFTVKTNGALADGKYNNRFYEAGLLIAADADYRYQVLAVKEDGVTTYKLLNTAGSEFKKGIALDTDDNYYVVKDGKIYVAAQNLEYAARAAQAFNSKGDGATFKVDDVTYTVTATADHDNVYTLTY